MKLLKKNRPELLSAFFVDSDRRGLQSTLMKLVSP